MNLPPNFYRPFDTVYYVVTGRIFAFIRDGRIRTNPPNSFTPDELKWLECLVAEFWRARDQWPENPLLASPSPARYYITEATRLRLRLLRLSACAFLHISYDLPRVTADQWPGTGPWKGMISENGGERLYFELGSIFPEVLKSVYRHTWVMGGLAVGLWFVPSAIVGATSSWMLLLRRQAWAHARRLANMGSGRAYVESQMIIAMTAALAHVKNLQPWTAGTLLPPDKAVFASAIVGFVGFQELLNRLNTFAFGAFSVASLAIYAAYSRQRRTNEIVAFINELGSRIMEYLDVAINNPEGLDNYIERRAPVKMNDSGYEPPASFGNQD